MIRTTSSSSLPARMISTRCVIPRSVRRAESLPPVASNSAPEMLRSSFIVRTRPPVAASEPSAAAIATWFVLYHMVSGYVGLVP